MGFRNTILSHFDYTLIPCFQLCTTGNLDRCCLFVGNHLGLCLISELSFFILEDSLLVSVLEVVVKCSWTLQLELTILHDFGTTIHFLPVDKPFVIDTCILSKLAPIFRRGSALDIGVLYLLRAIQSQERLSFSRKKCN